jgi:cytochrome c-type biogenesis protein CcmE
MILAVKNMNKKTKNKVMKSIIPLSAITILAALALMGCNQNSPSNSTDAQSTNSSTSDTNGTIGGITNIPATNSLPNLNTNMPASTNQ